MTQFSVAPMMDCTDRHCRYFHRLLSKQVILYTEMITAKALIHGDREYLLGFDPSEHPVIAQLGGADPKELATAAQHCEQAGYDQVNLNVGCPSDRVQAGAFGLALMKNPELVARCMQAMQAAISIPVTLKTRIGVDEHDSEAFLLDFIGTMAEAGVHEIILHARKGWLKGLTPKENRNIPPLNYERVLKVKATFPSLYIGINGGITTCEEAAPFVGVLDEIMIGRAAYSRPYLLAEIESQFLGGPPLPDRDLIYNTMLAYLAANPSLPKSILRHIMGLYHGQPNARAFRQHLTDTIKSR